MEELDLKEIFNIFWSKKGVIIFFVILFMIAGGLYSYFLVTPKYKAYTTLLLTTSNDEVTKTTETITTTDITLNNNLIATYSELIKSKTVLRQVISNLKLTESEEFLKANISVSAVKSTQVIQIDVVNEDANKAKVIANEVAKVFANKVEELYNINNVHVVDAAELPDSPYNINHVKNVAIFGAVGLVIACAYVFILNMIDTTIKNQDDIEKKLGLTVLVNIPNCDFDESIKAMKSVRKKGGRK